MGRTYKIQKIPIKTRIANIDEALGFEGNNGKIIKSRKIVTAKIKLKLSLLKLATFNLNQTFYSILILLRINLFSPIRISPI